MKAVLLVGSPKGTKSVSDALGTYLNERMRTNGAEVDRMYLNEQLRDQTGEDALMAKMSCSDIVILAFPLYYDSIPSKVIKLMDLVAEASPKWERRPALAVIVNSGFPEAEQSGTALRICRLFARDADMEWKGGLVMGMGMVLSGRSIGGGPFRHQRKALVLAADALNEGKAVPDEARSMMAKKPIMTWLYLMAANRSWKEQAKENGVLGKLYDRPYSATKKK